MKSRMGIWLWVCLLLLAVSSQSNGKVLFGILDTTETWVYLGKFAYDTKGPGYMYFEATDINPEADEQAGFMRLNLYNNEEGTHWYWYNIYNNESLSCEEKVALQHHTTEGDVATINGEDLAFELEESSVLTWYVTASDCLLPDGEDFQMEYRLHFVNAGSAWISEFSVEEQNILTIYFMFFLLWLLVVPAWIYSVYHFIIRQNRELDYVLKMFVVVLFFDTLSLLFYLLHYCVYAVDGIGLPALVVVGDVLTTLSCMLFMVVLLQIVSMRKTPLDLHLSTWVCVGILLFFYLAMFLWQEVWPGLHPETDDYKWQVIPGIIMLCLQSLIWVYFCGMTCFQMYRNPDRRVFLSIFLIVFSIWFLSLPTIVSIMALAPFYYRWKWVIAVVWSTNTVCYSVLMLLSLPNPISSKIATSTAFSRPGYNTDIIQPSLFDRSKKYEKSVISEDDSDDLFGL